jgi:2-polyprenyl-6-methoxyphenol hydroxylase-like FAD-dependent oxidoreductase
MAGLLAVRVLANHFERVTLIERDHYPQEPVFRPGVPQGHHIHILMARGQQILENLFPGIVDKLLARGAIRCDFLEDYIYHFASGWLPQMPSHLKGYTCTRLLIEWQVRQELLKDERVQIIEGHEVVDLVASSDKQAVTGVRLRERTRAAPVDSEIAQISADLVVDASGRSSHAGQWLEALDYEPPTEEVVNAFLGYATRRYAPPVDLQRTWKGMAIFSDPPQNLRLGVIWPIEGECWMVGLMGAGKDYPSTEEDAFLEFTKGLSDIALYEAVKDAHPLSPIYGYRQTENRLRHFERLKRQPEGFVVLGDACCAFNPVYGQGMSVAALGAVALDESIRQNKGSGLRGLPGDFQRKLARVNEGPWQLATASDYRVPSVEGGKLDWATKLQHRYLDGITELLPTDEAVHETFVDVIHMIQPATSLFNLAFIMKVLTHGLGRKPASMAITSAEGLVGRGNNVKGT